MEKYRFTLEPYKSTKSKHQCPNCGKKVFTRYIDTYTGEYIANEVGRCNREIKCGYHYKPRDFFRETKTQIIAQKPNAKKRKIYAKQKNKVSFIDNSLVNRSINYNNNFIYFLKRNLFGNEITKELVDLYKIGTSKHWQNSTIFWQIDNNYKVRSGKILLYNKTTGKRVKEPYPHINWIHKTEKIKDFNLQQCLFGLHLTNDKSKPIAIVESEKTAIISSVYIPQYIWLACGSLNNLSEKMLLPLKDRDVILFPDLKCFELWKNKIDKFSSLCNFLISDLLEVNSSEKEKKEGYDLADYLINLRINHKKFI